MGAWVNGTITNDGTITVTGKNATGVYVNGPDSSLTNTGTINADGASTTAIKITEGYAMHSGSILTSNGAKACSVMSEGRLDLSGTSANSISGAEGSTAEFIDDYTSAGLVGSLVSASDRFMDALLSSVDSDAAYNTEKAANLAGLGGVAHTAADVTNTSRSLTSRRIPASGSS